MENAAKALTIAGGIFIALMILGALILMFNNLSSYQNQNDATTKQMQTTDFNNEFTPYDKPDLTLMELKSIYNKIASHNKRNPDEIINTNIKDIYLDIEKDFKQLDEEQKQTAVFSCKGVGYASNGKINKMEFERVK